MQLHICGTIVISYLLCTFRNSGMCTASKQNNLSRLTNWPCKIRSKSFIFPNKNLYLNNSTSVLCIGLANCLQIFCRIILPQCIWFRSKIVAKKGWPSFDELSKKSSNISLHCYYLRAALKQCLRAKTLQLLKLAYLLQGKQSF